MLTLAVFLSSCIFPAFAFGESSPLPAGMPDPIVTGGYEFHLQGITADTDNQYLYWSYTNKLVKTDFSGNVLKEVSVDAHHGDLTFYNGNIYASVELGGNRGPDENNFYVYVYDTELNLVKSIHLNEYLYGVDGISYGKYNGQDRFMLCRQQPNVTSQAEYDKNKDDPKYTNNVIYEYSTDFNFIGSHSIPTGYTDCGIQSLEYDKDTGGWWIATYGPVTAYQSSETLYKLSPTMELVKKYNYDTSVGMASLGNNQFLTTTNEVDGNGKNTGKAFLSYPSEKYGMIKAIDAAKPPLLHYTMDKNSISEGKLLDSGSAQINANISGTTLIADYSSVPEAALGFSGAVVDGAASDSVTMDSTDITKLNDDSTGINDAISISLRFKVDADSQMAADKNEQFIAGFTDADGKHVAAFSYNKYKYLIFRAKLQDGTENNIWIETPDFKPGQWYHVVGTQGSDGAKFYIDGALKNTIAGSGAVRDLANFTIGYDPCSSNGREPLCGSVDDLYVYNKVLNQDEVNALAGITPSNSDSKILHYKMDTITDGKLMDSSENKINATVAGTTLVPDNNGTPDAALGFSGAVVDGAASDRVTMDSADITKLNDDSTGINDAISISLRFKIDADLQMAADKNEQFIAGFTDVEGKHVAAFSYNKYKYLIFRAKLQDGTENNIWIETPDFKPGQWYHVVGTQGSDGAKFYIDGVLKNTISTSGTVRDLANFTIGYDPCVENNREPLCGSVDDLYVYNRVLNQDEVNALAAKKEPGEITFTVNTVPKVKIKKAATALNLDGKLDEPVWGLDDGLTKTDSLSGTNNAARFGTLWDNQYIYYGVDVTDGNLVNSGAQNPWEDDSVEVYIDGDSVKGGYNDHSARYVFRYGYDNVYAYGKDGAAIANTTGILHKTTDTEKGYRMEIAIPWSILGVTPSPDKIIGFTTHVNDRDDANSPRSGVLMYTPDGPDSLTSANWAELKLISTAEKIILSKAENFITIDGIADELEWNICNELKEKDNANNNNMAKSGALWDKDYLYAAFNITDENVVNNDSKDPDSGTPTPWCDDSVELYIDGDLCKGSYNAHTVQYIFRYDDNTVYKYGNNGASIEGIEHKMVKTDTGYVLEVKIPWTAIGGLTVSGGKTIGLTAHVNDEVDGALGFTDLNRGDYADSSCWAEVKLSGPNGCVDYWSFDEVNDKTVADAWDTYNGIVHGAVLTDDAKSGKALYFDGNDVTINKPDLTGSWTATMWVKKSETSGDCSIIMSSNNSCLSVEQWPNTKKAGFTKMGVYDFTYNYIVPADTWVHLAYVCDGKSTALYANGTLVGYIKAAISCPLSMIGCGNYKGIMDEVRIYNKALDASEIAKVAGIVPVEPEPESTDYKVWVPANCEKILQDQQLPEQLSTKLELEAAQNEYEGGQVIINAADGAIRNGTANISDLVNGSSKIAADRIKIYREHYINVTEPTTVFKTGWYPDALIPLAGQYNTFNVQQGKNQGLWFTVNVPKGTPAGLYKGTITITTPGKTTTIPVELTVWGFELTDESHSEAAFAIWPEELLVGDPDIENGSPEHAQLLKNYYEYFLDYRLTPMDLPLLDTSDINAFVQEVKTRLSDPRVTSFRIPYYGDSDEEKAKTKQLVDLLKQEGLLDKGYFYLSDRIDEPTSDKYADVINYSSIIKAMDPDVRHLVTKEICNELISSADRTGVNTWCPRLDFFNRELVGERQQLGEHVWWYTCCDPRYPYPSYHVDDNLIGSRLLSWMQRYNKVEGNLYWRVNSCDRDDSRAPRDIWRDPLAWTGTNGDGYLVYPGVDYGIDGPIGTIRLESIRDGAEDYEYLWLLEQRLNNISKALGVENEFKAEDVLRPYYSRLFKDAASYDEDPLNLQQVRREIAQEIINADSTTKTLVTFGEIKETEAQMTIYTEPGAVVKVNGVQAAGQALGDAQRVAAELECQTGMNSVSISVEKDGKTTNITKTFKVESLGSKVYPVELNYCETQDDIDKWVPTDVDVSLAAENATEGGHSMKAIYSTADRPVISFKTNNGTVTGTDWSKFQKLEFDVYNADESELADIYIRFADKYNAFDDKHVKVGCKSSYHVSIPLNEIDNVDLSNISKVEIWMNKPTSPITLYFDKFNLMSDSLALKKIVPPLVVDGDIKENVWNICNELKGKLGNPNNTAKFGTLWDDENIYFAFDVTDDKLVNSGAAPWDDDGIELYIDGDLKKGGYNEHTAQFIFRWNDPQFYRYNSSEEVTENKGNIVYKMVQTDKGYTLEAAVPWEAIGVTPSEGKVIGITAHVNDKDVDDSSKYVSDVLLFTEYSSYAPDCWWSGKWANFKLEDHIIKETPTQDTNTNDTIKEPYDITEDGGIPKATVQAALNKEESTAETSIPSDLLGKLFEKAQEVAGEIRKAIIEVPQVNGAKTYDIGFNAADLTGANNANKQIDVRTPVANVVIPGSMFTAASLSNPEKIEISVGEADRSTIDSSLKPEIGGRPVIELSAAADGKKIEWNNPDAPVKVSLKYTPGKEELKDPEHIVVWYVDGSGNITPVPSGRYDEKTGMVTFTVTHFSKYAVAYVHKTFNDIADYKWASKQIEVLASKGIISGTSNTTFAPQENIKRADFIVLLVKALNLNAKLDSNFDDVETGSYYYDAVGIAKKLGIAGGTGKNNFNPEAFITRQDMMTIAARALHTAKKETVKGTAGDIKEYKDASKVASYAVEGVATLVRKGIISGYNNSINPTGSATRAEVAAVVYKLYDMYR